jgi:hypothetical protein
MCLRISVLHSVSGNEVPQPFVAQEDLVVTKILRTCKRGYETPYRNKKISFVFGRYRYHKVKFHLELASYVFMPNTYDVYEGIHSCECEPSHILGADECMFKAVIPKGTPFYIGIYDDVVSSKLIIYKDAKKVEGKRLMSDFTKKLWQDAKDL